ncbi:MAG: carbohydrate kinase family protein [Candidatus Thorarchaeota archaeon]
MVREIVAIGRINVDVIMQVSKIPAKNEHVTSKKGLISFGGSASNFAAQTARLGVGTGIVGCVGDDLYGQQALKDLSNVGVDTSSVLVLDNQPTGIFFLAEQRNGDRVVVSEPGANRFLEKHVLDEEYLVKSTVVHLAGAFPMMASRIQEVSTANGMIFSFDPGRAASSLDFKPILRKTDLLFLNQGELRNYFKINPNEKALKAFAKTIPGIVVVKRGAKGAVATDGFEYCTSQIFDVHAVDTLGAGDAFAAGFITAWTRAERIEQALHVGNAVAALTITKKGAQKGQPTMDETARLLKKNGVSIDSVLRTFKPKKRRKGKGRR